jgi:hypothetical protein
LPSHEGDVAAVGCPPPAAVGGIFLRRKLLLLILILLLLLFLILILIVLLLSPGQSTVRDDERAFAASKSLEREEDYDED